MKEKVAIYCRLSEEDRGKEKKQDDSNSILNQKAMLVQYSQEQKWEIYRIYSDDDYAGADRKRPEFCRLLKDAEDGKFQIVLCKTQSRFTRELELVEKYIHGLFPTWGIRFISIVDNADTANKGNKKARQINGLVNEWYLEDMSDNIRSVLVNRRQNGFHIGSFALYGYQKDNERKGHLVIDPEAAGIVREIFRMYAQGYGKTAIARILNDRGVPNPTEYKRLHGLRYQQPKQKNSTLWKYSAISNMLSNEIYIGNMVQGKYGSISYKTKVNKPRPKELWYRAEGTHEAIIEQKLWEQVQRRLSQQTRPFSTGKIGVFSGKVRCAGCGYTLRTSKSRGRHYLSCPTRNVANNACPGAFIACSALEDILLKQLNHFSSSLLLMEKLTNGRNPRPREIPDTEAILQKQALCDQKRREILDAVGALYLDKVRGKVTEECFESVLERYRLELNCCHREWNEITQRLSESEKYCANEPSAEDRLCDFAHPKHLTREMTALFVDHITVGKRKKGERLPPVTVYWNF